MKKTYKLIITAVVILIVALWVYSYFHVSGDEIDGVSKIATTSTVVIKKSYHGVTDEQEYILNAQQIEMLKTLILESNFTRDLSAWVRFYDKDMYSISVNDNDVRVWLGIHCIGNEYISIPDQFVGKHLKINNPNWKAKLEEIISLTKH